MRLYCAGSLVAPASSSPLGRWRDAAEDGCGGGVEALCNCATRKGLISYELGAGGPVLQPVAFLADPVTAVLPHAGGVMAALRMGHFGAKLHASKDGQTWEEVTAPAYPPEPEPPDTDQMGRPWPWRLDMIWTLESDGRGGFWAGTIPGGLFHSPDGVSWTLDRGLWDDPRRKQWFGGGYDTPGVHSVLVHPRDPDDVVIGVSCGGTWRTRDGGKAWALVGQGLYADFLPPPLRFGLESQDPHRLARCTDAPEVIWCQHHNGVFRSTDGGDTFVDVAPHERGAPACFGFGVAAHPRDGRVAWFVPGEKDERRVPVGARFVITKTSDGGQTFVPKTRGLPNGPAWDLVYRHAIAVDGSGQHLAVGSTTGNLWLSEDGGESFSMIGHLPPINALAFD